MKSSIKESVIFEMLTDTQKQIESLEQCKKNNTLSDYGKGSLDTFYGIKSKLLNLLKELK